MQEYGTDNSTRAGNENFWSSFRKAPVNSTVVMANIVVFVICMMSGNLLYDSGMLVAARVFGYGEYYRLVTSMFLHAGIQHIFGNMLILAYIGSVMERSIGHWQFGLLYFASGICGNIVSIVYEQVMGYTWYSLGASGAVFGVMGAMLLFIFHNLSKLQKGSTLVGRAAFMVAYSLYVGFASPDTNNIAHIGGLLTGILIGLLILKFRHTVNMNELV